MGERNVTTLVSRRDREIQHDRQHRRLCSGGRLEALRQHEGWRSIPIVVVTSKDLTAEDHQRLNGYVKYVIHKGTHGREELLQELGERIAACLRQVA